jgi:hypothetical protein
MRYSITRLYIPLLIIFLISTRTYSSATNPEVTTEKKQITAVRTATAPKIDGDISDIEWQKAPVASDFIQYSPYSGKPASHGTEVRILYDDEAIYIAAMMYDTNPDSIFMHLGKRDSDNSINADQFHIELSTFNDGINGETFKVSASGVQSDSKARSSSSSGGGGGGMWGSGDSSWDAVWYSKVKIIENGWVAEMKIPYSALRFPRRDVQTWGINFWREIRRYREQSSWSYVNREIGTSFSHLGELTGLTNLIPPVRLSLVPYLSGYAEKYNGEKPGYSYSGGLDLKYGINESFTLDATLIPDFGQVQSDDQVLNLTPYEVKYNERRPFFMEGTELFSRGNIFYSRRIGTKPRRFNNAVDDVTINENMLSNPQEASLINASKLSGRTSRGLGIGVFNAMTRPMYAEIEETATGDVRKFLTEPFTNFNMLVLDQSLKNNSYISLANSNVWRNTTKDATYYTANVTATDFKIQNRARMYSLSGVVAISQKYQETDPTALGHTYNFGGGKTGGAFRVEYQLEAISDTYDPNDMGYLRRNNEFQNSLSVSYNTHKPFWHIYTTRNSLSYSYNQLYTPRVFTGSSINFNSMIILSNYWSVSLRADYKPGGEDDYYEPRIAGRYYHRGKDLNMNFSFDTDKSKRYYFNVKGSILNRWSEYDQSGYTLSLQEEVKLSTRMSLELESQISKLKNDLGYVAYNSGTADIIFGKRDNTTLTSTLQSQYIFTADSYISLRLRHYWSRADYDGSFYYLNSDGSLALGSYSGNPDYNYNAFNIDMVYTWRFAPGSEMTLVWKNAIYDGDSTIAYKYMDNLRNMFESPMLNSFSLKILYYLDYQSLRKRD